jgi:hypothetical protein
MSFSKDFPDFAPVEAQVRRAHVQRAVYLSNALAHAIAVMVRAVERVANTLGDGYAGERDRRAIEADAFLRRSVPRY